MRQSLEVVVCGRSPFMDGMGIKLQSMAGLRVRRLGTSLPEAVLEIRMLSPHAVIFDLNEIKQSAIAPILQEYPGAMFIGLEAERDFIKAFFISEQRVSSLEEIAYVIREWTEKASAGE